MKSEGRNKPVRKPRSKKQLQGKEKSNKWLTLKAHWLFDNIAEPDRWICNIPTRKVTYWFTLKKVKRQAVFTKCYEMYFRLFA